MIETVNNFDFLDYREELKKKLSSPIPEGKDCISQCWRNVDLPPAEYLQATHGVEIMIFRSLMLHLSTWCYFLYAKQSKGGVILWNNRLGTIYQSTRDSSSIGNSMTCSVIWQ